MADGVCVDDMGKARVMEPVLADKASALKDRCVEFLNDVELYRGTADGFVGVVDGLAKRVDREKRDAIVASNRLASLSNRVAEEMAALRSQIEQKTTELDRYRIEHGSLQKIESEQTDVINRLSFQN